VFLHGIPTADGGRDVDPAHVTVRPDAPRLRPGRDLVLVHRDAQMVVVWKPPGLLSVPARNRPDGHLSVLGWVQRLTRGPAFAVHRLDEPTSGLLMVARNESAQAVLKEQLELHSVERRYLAVVSGHPPLGPVSHDTHFIRNRGDGLRGSIEVWNPPPADDHPGRRAVTHARRLDILDRRSSLVEATLESGRTHQVRIHLAEAGFPILGDQLYAPGPVAARSPRLALHAAVLGFVHPKRGESLRFVAPLPDDLEQLRRGMVREQADRQAPGADGGPKGKGSRTRPARKGRKSGRKGGRKR
jgi:23S rRNA pseudouridine1911/1915/1917 synthase